jgi:dTDP-4-dehydrorhamnose 3,5-epimerase-like enzyme
LPPVGHVNLRDGLAGDDVITTLSARKPQLLIVPPLYWHGWMSLEPNTMLLSLASREYDRDNPDEERIPFDAFGDHIWSVWNK